MSGKKDKNTDKGQKAFRPGTEKREIFSKVLCTISKLLVEKKIGIEIDSRGKFDFSIAPSEIKDCVSEEIGDKLSFDDFMNIISTEIESLLEASIYSDKVKGIENCIPSTIIKDVGMEEFLSRLEETEKIIRIPKALKQDLIFKKTVKGLTLEEIKWGKNCKTFDDELGEISNLEYVTLSILYSQPVTEQQGLRLASGDISIQIPSITEPKQITLELQKKDVTKLMDNLQRISEIF